MYSLSSPTLDPRFSIQPQQRLHVSSAQRKFASSSVPLSVFQKLVNKPFHGERCQLPCKSTALQHDTRLGTREARSQPPKNSNNYGEARSLILQYCEKAAAYHRVGYGRGITAYDALDKHG